MNKVTHFFTWLKDRHVHVIYSLGLLAIPFLSGAQEREISLKEAVSFALKNSHTLTKDKIQKLKSENQLQEAKNLQLPIATLGLGFSHMQVPGNEIMLGNHYLVLGKHGEAYNGSINISKDIYNNISHYKRKNYELLVKLADLDFEKNKDEIILNIVEQYMELYKIVMQFQVIAQNIKDVDRLIDQSEQFYKHGVVTKNDVLRFKLQKSDILIQQNELVTAKEIINYNLLILLGLHEDVELVPKVEDTPEAQHLEELDNYREFALLERAEVRRNEVYTEINNTYLKQVKGNLYPKLSVDLGSSYSHLGSAFLPERGNYIGQFAAGLSLKWNMDGLWLNKTKVNDAKIKQNENRAVINETKDLIKREVNNSFMQYQKSLHNIEILKASIDHAEENNRIIETQYENHIATVIDRIDANTQLFAALNKIEIAKTNAIITWYRFLKHTGKISNLFKEI